MFPIILLLLELRFDSHYDVSSVKLIPSVLFRLLIEFESPVFTYAFCLLILEYFLNKSLHLLNSDGSIDLQNLFYLSPYRFFQSHLVGHSDQVAEFRDQIDIPGIIDVLISPRKASPSFDHRLLSLSDNLIVSF